MNVPFLDLKAQHRTVKAEVMPLWEEILDSAGFVGGKHISGFEEEFAQACRASYCVAVANGTVALQFIFEALGLKPGDEVIVPVNTFIATSEAVSAAGGKPVFVDVLPETCNIDPARLEAAITPKTRGVAAVHLYGQPADMDSVAAVAGEFGLWVVEDAAQAHLAEYKGRRAGSMGIAAGFSFYPVKNLGACGDAGAITTNDLDLADLLRKLRDHGSAKKYYHDLEGYNGRCAAIQAAALRVKLKYLPQWNERRRQHARRYMDLLEDVPEVVLPGVREDCTPVWHLFVVHVDNRDAVQQALAEKGVATALHYPVPLHLQRAYAHMNLKEGTFPVAESYAQRLLSLPMYAELTDDQIRYVCDCLKEAVRRR